MGTLGQPLFTLGETLSCHLRMIDSQFMELEVRTTQKPNFRSSLRTNFVVCEIIRRCSRELTNGDI